MKKRLFIVAGYDATGIVDASLTHLVKSLSEFGDVVMYMDSDVPTQELKKLSPYVLWSGAKKHGEYDFGSYKRAYTYARDTGILDNYDFLYLVNDSVYDPLFDMTDLLTTMESYNVDAFGPVSKQHKTRPHIQSWFIGCHPSVFKTKWFDEFMTSVTKQTSKGQITKLYEQGFTKLITAHGLQWRTFLSVKNRGVYNKIKKLYKSGVPFMKKAAIPRHHGALGRQTSYILNHIAPETRDAIMDNARRTWGTEYMCWLLTKNPFKIMYRNLSHSLRKIFVEGI